MTRRRNYFIKKKFQANFILKFCLLVLLAALISALMIYHFSRQSVTTVFENSRLTIKPSTEFIMPALILSSLISVIFISMATAAVVLFLSHRIAGPLYKFESSLEKMADGDMSFDMHLRAGDEMKKLAEVFNAASRRLSSLTGNVKVEADQLDSAAKELMSEVEKMSGEQKMYLKQAIEKLDASNKRLREKINIFKLR